jgi:hypothetical protein
MSIAALSQTFKHLIINGPYTLNMLPVTPNRGKG